MKYFTQSGYFIQPEAVPFPGFSYMQEIDGDRDSETSSSVRHLLVCSSEIYFESHS